jgi:hypothetical protein
VQVFAGQGSAMATEQTYAIDPVPPGKGRATSPANPGSRTIVEEKRPDRASLAAPNTERVTTFLKQLDELQPSQLFISAEKLSRGMEGREPVTLQDLEPVPLKRLGGRVVLTDSHTRALAAHLSGLAEMRPCKPVAAFLKRKSTRVIAKCCGFHPDILKGGISGFLDHLYRLSIR